MTGSISLLVLIVFTLFILPNAFWKVGYDRGFPLRAHKFSFPLELVRFYLPYFAILMVLAYVFSVLEIHPIWNLFDHALFPHATRGEVSAEELFTFETVLLLILLFATSFAMGWGIAKWDKRQVVNAIVNGGDLISDRRIQMVGFWGALFHARGKAKIHIDILVVGDILYSGVLFHYESSENQLINIALKKTRRCLTPLPEIKGEPETFLIPGEVTYFLGAQIKNVNIRQIEQETETELIIGENILGPPDMSAAFEVILKEINEKFKLAKIVAPRTPPV